MPASRRINHEKSNRLISRAALEGASERIAGWWADAFLGQGEEARRRFFAEAGHTLPMLAPGAQPSDVIDAMQMHRIRLAKDQGLRAWEPRSALERHALRARGSESEEVG